MGSAGHRGGWHRQQARVVHAQVVAYFEDLLQYEWCFVNAMAVILISAFAGHGRAQQQKRRRPNLSYEQVQ